MVSMQLDGKAASEEIYNHIRLEVHSFPENAPCPTLAAILVGDNPAGELYIGKKIKACKSVGIKSVLVRLPETVTEQVLSDYVRNINADPEINGLIVQLPLPAHLSELKITELIDPAKDVDGFHPYNLGLLALGVPGLRPATPAGIVSLLDFYGIQTEGKHCVILGRSNIVGTPISILMSKNERRGNATVTLCHSKTPDPKEFTRQADILIVAVGKSEWVKGDWVKQGAVVVDVGIHRLPSASSKTGFRICGDVDYDSVAPRCSFITPVPGGVGLMTVAQLLKNTLYTYKKQHGLHFLPPLS